MNRFSLTPNLVALLLVSIAPVFIILHDPQTAHDLVVGALGIIGGDKLAPNHPTLPNA